MKLRNPLTPFLLCFLYFLFIDAPYAQAYLDPGTGSLLFSAVLGIVATLYFLLKKFYYAAAGFIFNLFGFTLQRRQKYGLVFYSEGNQYWNTFKPVIEQLDKRGIRLTYLSSGEDDEGLAYESETVETRYIGKGNKAYAALNMLEADLCVMTTPGLDVLQIRRSKGVKHYAFLFHSPTDAGMFKLFSFDYFDSVFCAGEHQIKSLRALEALRQTPAKALLKTGCAYMDVLAAQLANRPSKNNSGGPTVLIAPSWGPNGALNRFGSQPIKLLLDAGYDVIVRPHPQSYRVEKEMIRQLRNELKDYASLEWDSNADGFESLYNSDVLVSDWSGVIFDYALIFEKPVITLKCDINFLGMEANDLPHELWELTLLDQIGRQIDAAQMERLPGLIDEILKDNDRAGTFKALRERHIFNFGSCGEVAAQQILEIQKGLREVD